MSGKRNTLRINKLDAFKLWLELNEIPHRPGKGAFQILQVLTSKNGWQCVYSRHNMIQCYTVQDKLMYLVKRFIKENKAEV